MVLTAAERIAKRDDEIVETELPKHWIRAGERLLFGCAPIRGYVRARIGAEARLPHTPLSEMPALDLGPCRWPLPAEGVADEDWTDDPTVAFFVFAPRPDAHAVAFGDHFAHSRGEARLVLSSQRVAVIYTTKLFHTPEPGEPLFITALELDRGQVASFSAPFAGRSIPPVQVIRVDFADGSTLFLRDPLAGLRVSRAASR